MKTFYSPGKLLISGEYAVLCGAEALAIPTQLGQRMEVSPSSSYRWNSYEAEGQLWFTCEFDAQLQILSSSDAETAQVLKKVLVQAKSLNTEFWSEPSEVHTYLEFERDWGLGSSSTLICLIAKWAEVDAFALSEASFGGSGYDIAVGMVGSEMLYSRPPAWDSFVWNPPFADHLFFIHLNRKQNSRESIAQFDQSKCNSAIIETVSDISRAMAQTTDANEFQLLMTKHEHLISGLLDAKVVKEELFADYPYAIKSLGGWGGDFVLAFGNEAGMDYFKQAGYATIIPFKAMKAN